MLLLCWKPEKKNLFLKISFFEQKIIWRYLLTAKFTFDMSQSILFFSVDLRKKKKLFFVQIQRKSHNQCLIHFIKFNLMRMSAQHIHNHTYILCISTIYNYNILQNASEVTINYIHNQSLNSTTAEQRFRWKENTHKFFFTFYSSHVVIFSLTYSICTAMIVCMCTVQYDE